MDEQTFTFVLVIGMFFLGLGVQFTVLALGYQSPEAAKQATLDRSCLEMQKWIALGGANLAAFGVLLLEYLASLRWTSALTP